MDKGLIYGMIVAIVMVFVLFGTGAAQQIISSLGGVFGGIGILLAIVIIFGLVFAGFNKRK